MRWRPVVRLATTGILAGLVVAIAVGLPVGDLGGQVQRDLGDPLLNVWALSWESTALVTDPGALYDGNIFWPESSAIAYSESMLPLVPVFGMLRVVTGSELAANAVLIWLLVLGAVLGCYLLARRYVSEPVAALFGAVSYGLGGYTISHVAQVQLLTLGTLPVVFLLWFLALEKRSLYRAVWCGVAVAVASLSSLYYGVVLAPALALAIVVQLVVSGRWRDGRSLLVAGVAGAVAIVLVVPGVVVYLELAERNDLERPLSSIFELSLDDFVTPAGDSVVYPGMAERGLAQPAGNEHSLFPGFSALALAAGGVVALVASASFRRRVDGVRTAEPRDGPVTELIALLAAGALAAVLALGGEVRGVTMPFAYLHDHLPGFSSIRATSRLAVVTLVALAVLAAVALDALVARIASGRTRLVVGGVLVAVLTVELWSPVPWREVDRSTTATAVYRELDDRPEAPVVELPMGDPRFGAGSGVPTWGLTEPSRMVRSLLDDNPRVNGYSGYLPEGYLERLDGLREFPSPSSLDLAEDLGIGYVILHTAPSPDLAPQYTPDQVDAIVEDLPEGWAAEPVGEAWLLTSPLVTSSALAPTAPGGP
jgi:hypothetical protein